MGKRAITLMAGLAVVFCGCLSVVVAADARHAQAGLFDALPLVEGVPAVHVTHRHTAPQRGILTVAQIEQQLVSHALAELLESGEIDGLQVAVEDLGLVGELVWQTYLRDVKADERRVQEHADKRILHGDKTMRYTDQRVGEKPAEGYPLYIALHGGGGAPTRVNDSQWLQMQSYYLAGITNGIYVATRGVTDTWNLHFVDESYPLYDRLIQNMVVFEGVNPNRVYLLGFSAGGDGVYQIGARMADRWAGAAMSAGHHNSVSPVNYAQLPLLIQMGARDGAYNRNTAAAEYGAQLRSLQGRYPGLYRHDVYLHVGRGHGIMDRDARGLPQQIYADPMAWLALRNAAQVTHTNTYSIHWLAPFTRNPLPERVIWDSATTTKYNGNRLNWLRGRPEEGMEQRQVRIDVRYIPDANAIRFEKLDHPVTILLNQHMLDLDKPAKIHLPGGQTLTVQPVPRLDVLIDSLLERGDPDFMFPVKIDLIINAEGDWIVQ